MDTYLLDTNLVSILYDSSRSNHASVRATINQLETEAAKLISVVTLAELKYGLALSKAVGRPLHHIESCISKAEKHPPLVLGKHTADAYAYVKSNVALKHVNVSNKIPKYVEDWTNRISAKSLQIDENDLWIAAQAIERNLVLITGDSGFKNIIAPAIPELRVWTV